MKGKDEWRLHNDEGAQELGGETTNSSRGKKTSIFHRRCNKKAKDERESKGHQRAARTKDGKQELAAIFYQDKIWKMSPNFIVAWAPRGQIQLIAHLSGLRSGARTCFIYHSDSGPDGRCSCSSSQWRSRRRTSSVFTEAAALAKRISVCITHSSTIPHVVVFFWRSFIRNWGDPVIQLVSDVRPVSHSTLAEHDRKERLSAN